MATPFSDVYDFFLSKVSDYNFISLNETGDLEKVLFKYMRSALVRFTSSNKEISFDTNSQKFTDTLSDIELEIISTLMTINYVSSKITHVKNMEQILSDKEYKIYSTQSHLGQLINLKKELNLDASNLMTQYSYQLGLDNLE